MFTVKFLVHFTFYSNFTNKLFMLIFEMIGVVLSKPTHPLNVDLKKIRWVRKFWIRSYLSVLLNPFHQSKILKTLLIRFEVELTEGWIWNFFEPRIYLLWIGRPVVSCQYFSYLSIICSSHNIIMLWRYLIIKFIISRTSAKSSLLVIQSFSVFVTSNHSLLSTNCIFHRKVHFSNNK